MSQMVKAVPPATAREATERTGIAPLSGRGLAKSMPIAASLPEVRRVEHLYEMATALLDCPE
jgi:hypothetical protein